MNKSLLLALFALLFSLSLHAQSSRDSIAVYANVMDSFTHEMLKGVRITVMRSDSTVVGEYTTDREYRYGGYKHNFNQLGYLYLLRADHIFRFAKEGYATHYLHLRQRDLGRRETRRFLGEIFLKKLRGVARLSWAKWPCGRRRYVWSSRAIRSSTTLMLSSSPKALCSMG